ncbi:MULTISPECIES: polymer-forming cytoskeletal protein [unclassified Rhodanobacter]|uniref:bactofilin family protein n=1 Tax=unclassified Rhodanobacter TaxID=2621553 RepID=UPI001BDE2D40|nr:MULTISPECIES: polymer-forming cytoskeletal protein [unclassified Rhodanobacter]MBT2144245.1 polymer-forming cytoskeletal protein [Rhodanobacter sp. LX-99]MBT2150088.1 polymer-forming cytoskeletal protein [Rhodanobacter sp. LX-100]
MLNRRRSDRNDRNNTSHETSLIARGTVIRGDLRFSGALHLDGRIEGTVLGEGDDAMFTLSEHGQVHGEIHVPQAVINGHVTGDVNVSVRLELAPQARIDGDLRYHTLEMAAGAQVNGRISRQAEQAQRELPAPDAELDEAMPA